MNAVPTYVLCLQPAAWTAELHRFDLKGEALVLALVLAYGADDGGQVVVRLRPIAERLGLDGTDPRVTRRLRHLIEQLRDAGLLHLKSGATGRGTASVWQLVRP